MTMTYNHVIGNYYGEDTIGNTEVTGSCTILGISDRHCNVLDVPELQDSPNFFWPTTKIEAVVKDYVSRWSVDAVSPFLRHPTSIFDCSRRAAS